MFVCLEREIISLCQSNFQSKLDQATVRPHQTFHFVPSALYALTLRNSIDGATKFNQRRHPIFALFEAAET
jgi:hypothetical protein